MPGSPPDSESSSGRSDAGLVLAARILVWASAEFLSRFNLSAEGSSQEQADPAREGEPVPGGVGFRRPDKGGRQIDSGLVREFFILRTH